jgi:hypothetical protein
MRGAIGVRCGDAGVLSFRIHWQQAVRALKCLVDQPDGGRTTSLVTLRKVRRSRYWTVCPYTFRFDRFVEAGTYIRIYFGVCHCSIQTDLQVVIEHITSPDSPQLQFCVKILEINAEPAIEHNVRFLLFGCETRARARLGTRKRVAWFNRDQATAGQDVPANSYSWGTGMGCTLWHNTDGCLGNGNI